MFIQKIIPPRLIKTDKDSHFTGSLATNAMEFENITGLETNSCTIVQVEILSDQNLDWDVYFFAKDTADDTDLDLDEAIGRAKFVVADGEQIAAAGPYRYSTATASGYSFRGVRYIDTDKTHELHMGLVNRNATSKNAGATGEVVVRIVYEPDELLGNFSN